MNINDLKNKFDKTDQEIIVNLLVKKEKGELSIIDEIYLNKLLKKEIDYRQIEQERLKSKEDAIYFLNNYIYVKNKINNLERVPEHLRKRIIGDKIKFELYPIQEKLARAILNHDKVISVKSRQIGFTTTTGALALQLITFFNNKSVILISKSEKAAIDTLSEIKFMYNSLPFFLKRRKKIDRESKLELGSISSSSSITSLTSGKNTGRSASATQLILDEAEFIKNIEELYAAAYPTLSATGGKIIILSTPYQYGSQFYNMVVAAEEKRNGFILIKGHQKDIPGRDEEQYKDQCEGLGQDKNAIKTELEMQQILPGEPYFDEDKVMRLKEYEVIENHGIFEIYTKPEEKRKYIISVDPSEDGNDYTVIFVIDIATKDVVAGARTKVDIIDELIAISRYYNNAKIVVEKNRGFHIIVSFEKNGYEDLLAPNLKINQKTGKIEIDENKKGIQTSSSNRQEYFIEVSKQLNNAIGAPVQLKRELLEVIIKKGKPVGLNHDDAVLSLGIGLYYITLLSAASNSQIKNKYIKTITKYLQLENKNNVDINEEIENLKQLKQVPQEIDDELKKKIFKAAVDSNDFTLLSLLTKDKYRKYFF